MKYTSSTNSLIGIDIVNEYEINLGYIEDLIANLETHRLEYVLVSAGSFLGLEDDIYAIPISYLAPFKEGRSLMFNPQAGNIEQEELPTLPPNYRYVDVYDVKEFVHAIFQSIDQPGHRSDVNLYEQN